MIMFAKLPALSGPTKFQDKTCVSKMVAVMGIMLSLDFQDATLATLHARYVKQQVVIAKGVMLIIF